MKTASSSTRWWGQMSHGFLISLRSEQGWGACGFSKVPLPVLLLHVAHAYACPLKGIFVKPN